MDIHAPEHPIHSWREFAVHIAVVTVGILIALGLEGVREAVTTHHLLRETRETIRSEMEANLQHMHQEQAAVLPSAALLNGLVAQLPAAASNPAQVNAVLATVHNPNYFVAANSWQAALSTGALGHLKPAEASDYAYAAEAARNYSQWQTTTLEAKTRADAFWQSHATLTPDQSANGMELLRIYNADEQTLAYLLPQTVFDFERALHSASR